MVCLMSWTKWQQQTLQSMLNQGRSRSEISAIICKSLNAIHGHIWRDKIQSPPRPKKQKRLAKKEQIEIIRLPKVEIKVEPERYTESRTCLWIHGEPRERSFCKNISTHGSWCKSHAERVFVSSIKN